MNEFKIGLDALMLFLLVAYALSLLAAFLPEPQQTEPRELASKRRLRLFLPPLGAMALVLSGFWPHVLAGLGLGTSHGWPVALQATKLSDELTLALLLAWGGWGLWQAFAWCQARLQLHRLTSVAAPTRADELRRQLTEWGFPWEGKLSVIASDVPLAIVFGVLTPHLLLSTAVLEELSSQDLQAIIAHEQAHVQRKDNAWRFLAQLALITHLPGLGGGLFQRWAQAAEGACDAIAAQRLGSAVPLAEALLHYRRLQQARGNHLKPAFRGGACFANLDTLQSRVHWLLASTPSVSPAPFRLFWLWLLLPLAIWQADGLHRHLEALLGLLHH